MSDAANYCPNCATFAKSIAGLEAERDKLRALLRAEILEDLEYEHQRETGGYFDSREPWNQYCEKVGLPVDA